MKTKNILLVLIVFVFIMLPSCNSVENDSTSGSLLFINSITGNDLYGTPGSTTIFVDVVQVNDDGTMTIYNDNGVVELTAMLIDPYADLTLSTYYQNIQIETRFILHANIICITNSSGLVN